VPKLSGFCVLMKRAVYDAVGGLDERARRVGFALAVAKDLFIHHFGSRTFVGNGIDAESLLEENARRFTDNWGRIRRPAGGWHCGPGPERVMSRGSPQGESTKRIGRGSTQRNADQRTRRSDARVPSQNQKPLIMIPFLELPTSPRCPKLPARSAPLLIRVPPRRSAASNPPRIGFEGDRKSPFR
jgi:hypothetical protein